MILSEINCANLEMMTKIPKERKLPGIKNLDFSVQIYSVLAIASVA